MLLRRDLLPLPLLWILPAPRGEEENGLGIAPLRPPDELRAEAEEVEHLRLPSAPEKGRSWHV